MNIKEIGRNIKKDLGKKIVAGAIVGTAITSLTGCTQAEKTVYLPAPTKIVDTANVDANKIVLGPESQKAFDEKVKAEVAKQLAEEKKKETKPTATVTVTATAPATTVAQQPPVVIVVPPQPGYVERQNPVQGTDIAFGRNGQLTVNAGTIMKGDFYINGVRYYDNDGTTGDMAIFLGTANLDDRQGNGGGSGKTGIDIYNLDALADQMAQEEMNRTGAKMTYVRKFNSLGQVISARPVYNLNYYFQN
jgi:hypothetical protein